MPMAKVDPDAVRQAMCEQRVAALAAHLLPLCPTPGFVAVAMLRRALIIIDENTPPTERTNAFAIVDEMVDAHFRREL